MATGRSARAKTKRSRGAASSRVGAGELRSRAEKRLARTEPPPRRAEADDPRRLLHELDVHRIQLELQNEELRSTRQQLEEGLERYARLFEFAPIGYAVLSRDGTIHELNVAATRLLGGGPASTLVGRRIGVFVPDDHREALCDFLVHVLDRGGQPEACELPIEAAGVWRDLRLTGVAVGDRLGAILVALEDVTARKRAEAELRESEAALRDAHRDLEARVVQRTSQLEKASDRIRTEARARDELRRRLATVQEDERRRVARDLHDSVGQLVAALSLSVKTLGADVTPSPSAGRALAEVEHLVDAVGREVHELAVRLRPTALDDLGLRAALEQLVAEWSAGVGTPADLQLLDERLPDEVETVLYRVVQEALTNVAKHARAKGVSVVVTRYGDVVSAVVEDDGVGFDADTVAGGRLGLVGMRERVTLAHGDLVIEARPGGGTSVIARVPIVERSAPR